MDSLTLLIDSSLRVSGNINHFTMLFDLGLNVTPEIIKVLQVIIPAQGSIPPNAVYYVCSDIIGGYSNGYYDVGTNIQSTIGPYNIIAVVPVTNSNDTIVYRSNATEPYFTCLGTIFGKKHLNNQPQRAVTFLLVDKSGNPVNILTDWTCIIECKLLNNTYSHLT